MPLGNMASEGTWHLTGNPEDTIAAENRNQAQGSDSEENNMSPSDRLIGSSEPSHM